MKSYTCDFCQISLSGTPEIILTGVSAQSDILLPARFQEKHFCKSLCFWQWTKYNIPDDGNRLIFEKHAIKEGWVKLENNGH